VWIASASPTGGIRLVQNQDDQPSCSGLGYEFEADVPEIVTSVHVAGIDAR
jgi:hypothetical protein